MNVYWLEQTELDLPAKDGWLSAREQARLNEFLIPKRRADWRLGRWTAKRALSVYLNLPPYDDVLSRIEILPASSGAPEAFISNRPAGVTISLSHRSGTSMCAVSQSGAKLGCDLEMIEPRSDGFLADYFTVEEQDQVARASAAERSRLLALLWSGKESALKALREGLRLDTRCVIVNCAGRSCDFHGWSQLRVLYTGGCSFRGWWRRTGDLLWTLVADPAPDPPIQLQAPGYSPEHMTTCA